MSVFTDMFIYKCVSHKSLELFFFFLQSRLQSSTAVQVRKAEHVIGYAGGTLARAGSLQPASLFPRNSLLYLPHRATPRHATQRQAKPRQALPRRSVTTDAYFSRDHSHSNSRRLFNNAAMQKQWMRRHGPQTVCRARRESGGTDVGYRVTHTAVHFQGARPI